MPEQPLQPDEPTEPRSDCPVCGKRVAKDAATYPFCGDRCRKIDLGRWLSGDYVISRPIEQSDLDEE